MVGNKRADKQWLLYSHSFSYTCQMDIEGSEYYALQGMKKTIQRFLPVLAFSVYHKRDDFTKSTINHGTLNIFSSHFCAISHLHNIQRRNAAAYE